MIHPSHRIAPIFLLVTFVVALSSGCATARRSVESNQVHVLHEGYVRPIEGREFVPGATPDGAREVGSTITLVLGPEIVLVADPGMTTGPAWASTLAKMRDLGVRPRDVTHVFISHHHPDHITRLGVFPNAKIVDHWGYYEEDIWSDHPDEAEVAPGIRVFRTPGHTHEDATLVIETSDGVYALTHVWWMPGYEPAQDPLAEDPAELEVSRKKILEIADWIVPGHGPAYRNTRKP